MLGGNAVTMGEAVKARLAELESQIPVGMELGIIYMQSDMVIKAVDGFIINLVEAVGIEPPWVSYVGDYPEADHLCRVYGYTLPGRGFPVPYRGARWLPAGLAS